MMTQHILIVITYHVGNNMGLQGFTIMPNQLDLFIKGTLVANCPVPLGHNSFTMLIIYDVDPSHAFSITGINTNIDLQRDIISDAAFKAGETNIHYLEKKLGL